jgi:HEAT repeat protein
MTENETKQKLDSLLEALDRQNYGGREEAVIELGRLGDARALVPLRRAQASRTGGIRYHAKQALKSIKKKLKKQPPPMPDDLKPFIKHLFYWWGGIDNHSTKRLAHSGNEAVLPYLVISLFWGSLETRTNAVTGLGKIGGAEAAEPLIFALTDNDEMVHDKAWWEIVRIGKEAVAPVIKELGRGNYTIRGDLIRILGEITDPGAIPILIRYLKDPFQRVRELASAALSKFGADAVDPLLEALNKNDEDIPPEAVKTLVLLEDHISFETFTGLLKDPRYTIRVEAVKALARFKDRRAMKPLLEVLSDPDKEVRAQAANALGVLADPAAVETLIRALDDPRPLVWEEAAEALGKIGDKRAIEPLAEKLAAAHLTGYGKTALALSEFGDARALRHLANLVANPSLKTPALETALDLLQFKTSSVKKDLYCKKCLRRSTIHAIAPTGKDSWWDVTIDYYACAKCHGNLYLTEDFQRLTWVLDRGMAEVEKLEGDVLTVNALKKEEVIDFDEIRIIDADDYQVEKFVMRLKNDMDEYHQDSYRYVTVHLAPGLNLSSAKLNLLRDNFNVQMI